MDFFSIRRLPRHIGKSFFHYSFLKTWPTGRWDSELNGSEDLSCVKNANNVLIQSGQLQKQRTVTRDWEGNFGSEKQKINFNA